ncbi:phasin [Nostoc sp. 3335mG]|nr:phasin [Nostoc sp. 3335mG]
MEDVRVTTRGPKTGARKSASSRSTRPVAVPPVAAAVPEPVVPAIEAEQAEVPPVPFVAAQKPAPVELPFKTEAAAVVVPTPPVEPVVEAAKTVAETVEVAAEDTTKAVETVSAQVEEKTMDVTNEATATAQNAANKAQNLMADMNEKAKAAMEKGAKGFEEMNEMAKGNIEAMVESSRIAAKGLETLGQEMAEYGRKSFEHATSTAKTLATVKSPTEFMKLQSDFVRQSFDSFVAEASKATEMMIKLAGDAAQPISNRVAVAADKVKVAA